MINIILFNPQIPQNTGNIARTCVVCGLKLHLIKPYGFILNDKNAKRAGLDYWDELDLYEYKNFDEFLEKNSNVRIFPVTTKTTNSYSDFEYKENDFFLFGSETSGLPKEIHDMFVENRIRIPMLENQRCLNLSNSVAVIAYEALRQNGFKNLV